MNLSEFHQQAIGVYLKHLAEFRKNEYISADVKIAGKTDVPPYVQYSIYIGSLKLWIEAKTPSECLTKMDIQFGAAIALMNVPLGENVDLIID